MFYAIDQQGERCALYQLSLQEVMKAREKRFYCPDCNERLQIRSGRRITPHFAHYPRSECLMNHSGESMYHERGKWALYRWLRQQNYQVELECYLAELKQRPDILLTINGRLIAIELQCATIPMKDIEQRTNQYLKYNIFPLWILGRNQLKSSKKNQVMINDFHRAFLYHFHQHYQLLFFDADHYKIIIVSSIQGLIGSKAYADIHTYPIHHISFPQLFSSSYAYSYSLLKSWERLLYNHRTKYKHRVRSSEQDFRQWLYVKGHHFSLIPTACFLPLKSQATIRTPPYIWQTSLMMNHFVDQPLESPITFPIVQGEPTMNGYQPNLTDEYMERLAVLGFLERKGHHWIKRKEVVFHKHMYTALKDDHDTIKLLKNFHAQEGIYS